MALSAQIGYRAIGVRNILCSVWVQDNHTINNETVH